MNTLTDDVWAIVYEYTSYVDCQEVFKHQSDYRSHYDEFLRHPGAVEDLLRYWTSEAADPPPEGEDIVLFTTLSDEVFAATFLGIPNPDLVELFLDIGLYSVDMWAEEHARVCTGG